MLNRRIRDIHDLGLLAIFACVGIGGSGTAIAQDSDGASGQLEEITVTARRFGESLQDAPVAVTAMTADFLAAQRMQEVHQVIEMTPGATMTIFNKGQMDLSMRGISSQGEGAASDSAVMIVVDDVVVGKDVLKILKFYDVEQIEVLRGPQGTAFGKNASAGAIHIVNARPTREGSGFIEATAGDFNLFELNGAVNGAIGDTAAGRLSFHYDDRDGYTTDTGTGKPLDDVNNVSVRGQLLFDPSDAVQIWLKAEYSKDDDGNRARRSQDCTTPYVDGFGVLYQDPCDFWKTETSEATEGPFKFERDVTNLSASIDWDMSDNFSLTSTTAYISADVTSDMDNFGSPVNLVYNLSMDDVSQFSQEFRLDNANSASSTNWLVGLFYLTDDHDRSDNREILNYHPASTPQGSTMKNETDSLALFGQVSFALSDRFQLTVGGRYAKDEKTFSVNHRAEGALADIFIDPPGDSPIIASNLREEWSNFSGSVSLTYDVSDSTMIYGLVSQGYKTGGFNPEPATLEAAMTPYDEETALNIEAGAKMDLANDRLRLNISIFDLTYDDLQVEGSLPSGTQIIENAGGADVTGAELEFTWLASDNFTLMGSYASIDGEMRGDIGGNSVDGFRTQNAPDWTATLAAIVSIPMSNGSELGLRADYRSRGTAYDSPDETDPRPGVDYFGAAVTWDSADGAWHAALWGRNLGNEAEMISIGPAALTEQSPTGFGPPRTYGLTLRYNVQ